MHGDSRFQHTLCTAPAVFIRGLAHKDLFALVDVDAGSGRHLLAHGLTHQVIGDYYKLA